MGHAFPASGVVTPGRAELWVPDLGDGTYKNPILFAGYSDPDVVKVGDDFYMTASSFHAVPALPIFIPGFGELGVGQSRGEGLFSMSKTRPASPAS